MQCASDDTKCPGCIALKEKKKALMEEIRAFKLKLYWKDHNISQLETAMSNANQCGPDAPMCRCLACAVSGRLDKEEESNGGFECFFKPYFETLLSKCGMTFQHFQGKDSGQHDADDSGNSVYDDDTHFVFLGRDDWFAFAIGAKLWKATTVDNPELRKLSTLFQSLNVQQ